MASDAAVGTSPVGQPLPERAAGAQEVNEDGYIELIGTAKVRPWDVKHGVPESTSVDKLSMVVPTVARVALNLLTAPLVAGGYAMGKVGEAIGIGKSVDSHAFRAGITSWMWSNGIFPSVVYESFGEAGTSNSDMSLTPIIISNHTCYLDGLILAIVFGLPKIVAMAGSRKTPIFGRLMEEMDVVFVDRSSGDSREATLTAIKEHCNTWSLGDRPLLIFPEGTTTNGEGVLDFKKGAFVTGMPVRPVLIVYTGGWDPATTTWAETADGNLEQLSDTEWMANFLGGTVHSLHIRVLAPYIPNKAEQEDPALYSRNVQEHMSMALQRVRKELGQNSWKEAVGRTHGGLGYRLGDETRIVARTISGGLGAMTSCITRPGHSSGIPLVESQTYKRPEEFWAPGAV